MAALILAGSVVVAPCLAAAQAPADLLLDDVGSGFAPSGPDTGTAKALTRHFQTTGARLDLEVIPVEPSVDVAQLFQVFSQPQSGLHPVAEPSLTLGSWLVGDGEQVGDGPVSFLVFASAHAIFSTLLVIDDPSSGIDAVDFLLSVAERQIERAGGPPEAAAVRTAAAAEIDPALERLLPEQAGELEPAGTFDLGDELPSGIAIDNEVARFLENGSSTVVRGWIASDGSTAAVVSLTRYPFDLFAAAALGTVVDGDSIRRVEIAGLESVRGAIAFVGTGDRADQIGVALRRGRFLAMILTSRQPGVPPDEAAAVAGQLTLEIDRLLPAGATSIYRFPGATSTVAGVLISIGLVTAAIAGSVMVGRFRARRLRRRWSTAAAPLPMPAVASSAVLALDDDATRLRRRAGVVLGGQLLSVNVGVGALSGDFGWPGAGVAAVALVGGLLFTAWWSKREHAILGPVAPRIDRILPQPRGALLGVVAFAVLGFGAGFGLKGLRYLVLKPSLAQLNWADFFGLTPRAVAVLFFVGGVVVVVLGSAMFRLARAWSRADSRHLLNADRRPPVLYLRSFEDDTVLLATIVSARRPMLELFSLRGADPFEESIAAELDTYGPVIAVGRPGRSLASLGAAREHLPDATWKDEVAARMAAAGTVVVATGETDGLRWELGRLVQAGHLAKTVFVFPPLGTDEIGRRWDYTAEALRQAGSSVGALPAGAGTVHTAQVGEDGAVTVTVARRRDEASYRTAIDRAMAVRSLVG